MSQPPSQPRAIYCGPETHLGVERGASFVMRAGPAPTCTWSSKFIDESAHLLEEVKDDGHYIEGVEARIPNRPPQPPKQP